MKLSDFIRAQKEFSLRAFGEGARAEGICKHIEKELAEIRANPTDIMEWVDVVILALDGAWRAGYDPITIVDALREKQRINMARQWPTKIDESLPVEHVDCREPRRD